MITEFGTLENAVLAPSRYTATMFRRWLIRSIFVVLCMCMAGVWAVSYAYVGGVRIPIESPSVRLNAALGSFYFWAEDHSTGGSDWVFHANDPGLTDALQREYQTSPHLGGFAYRYLSWPDRYLLMVILPLWFPTLLSALLLYLVWRKTRAKPIGGAFPVEPAKAEVK